MGDGTAIHITIARYYTPSGRSIQNEGITPDVEVLHSKVEVLEKKESMYSEASFKNSLKNEDAKKQDKKKSDDDDASKELSDAEKDALDYQLQRGMDMVRAMSKMRLTAADRIAAVEKENADKEAAVEKSDKKDDKKKSDKTKK